jgi:hypothetical protein
MIAIAKTLAVAVAGLLVAAMGFHHTGGPMTAQAASQIRAGDPPPCLFRTTRTPCNDYLAVCIELTKDICEKNSSGLDRECVHCTSQSGQDDIVECSSGGDAWTLICETKVDVGGCGNRTESVCRWIVNGENEFCQCTEGAEGQDKCNSETLKDWDGNCTRRP